MPICPDGIASLPTTFHQQGERYIYGIAQRLMGQSILYHPSLATVYMYVYTCQFHEKIIVTTKINIT